MENRGDYIDKPLSDNDYNSNIVFSDSDEELDCDYNTPRHGSLR